MKRLILLAASSALLTLTIALFSGLSDPSSKKLKKPRILYAGKALSTWHEQRAYPGKTINMSYLTDGFRQAQNQSRSQAPFPGQWEPIGPMNFGGRTLALAFNPQNPNTMFAGSASGGLWRTYSGANGAQAWHQVETGFPILGVASIAINPLDSNEIYIGTGEVYNDQQAGTGFAVRTTRGTYGIGLLKSSDGGQTWTKSIDWQYDELKGVQDIVIHPTNPAIVLAATTEGTFLSQNSGVTWTLVHPARMATDLIFKPGDPTTVFLAAGNSFSANPGIYRSSDGGATFTQLTAGLPSTYSGKAMLDICRDNPNIIYASIAEQLTGLGLFKSVNGGNNWTQINSTDYQTYQGWYSHDVSVNPSDADNLVTCGIDMWHSTDGGANLTQNSYWYLWDFNDTTVGGPEGPADYVHADIHRIVRHPQDDNTIYLATDGGVFRSFDSGLSFEGCNGSYHTQQFYANFSCSASDSLFAIGGMQDNATAVYEGNPGWRRVIGGDGLSTAIDPTNDQIVYGSSQYLNVDKSTDKAVNFSPLNINYTGQANFAGPYALSTANPSILYAATTRVYKTSNGGQLWVPTNGGSMLDGNPVLVIEISDNNPAVAFAATAPVVFPQVALWKTTDGGVSWLNVIGTIPNRYIMDVEVVPGSTNNIFVAIGGFGTPHLYKSTNGGLSWSVWGTGLPDVPTNTICIDPLNTSVMYLGNDLGVYVSIDGGLNWQPFNDGLVDATLIMDITVSPSNRKLRLATHGKGVYERDMLPVSITGIENVASSEVSVYPNPVTTELHVSIKSGTTVNITITDVKGALVYQSKQVKSDLIIPVKEWRSGTYLVKTDDGKKVRTTKVVKN
ncbi:MAG: T9SS type A sorting domain-containing protein [Bacteroidetes bacterium]|nr:T9SS type A sorting domain-containing protein [Bacteroidota bacterium]